MIELQQQQALNSETIRDYGRLIFAEIDAKLAKRFALEG